MKIKLFMAMITVVTISICTPLICRADGPFGIEMGSSVDAYKCDKIKDALYECKSVPRPHIDFSMYLVRYHPSIGICWVKGVSADIQTNSFGAQLQAATDKIAAQVALTYGPETKGVLGLLSGSIWRNPNEWMISLLKNERFYDYYWSSLNEKLKNNIWKIYVSAVALSEELGFVSVEFSFNNENKCDAQLQKDQSQSF